MTVFEIAILGFAVAGFAFAVVMTFRIGRIEIAVNEILRRDDDASVRIGEDAIAPQKPARIRTMHGDYR
jgi:hypothetical protein